MTPLALLAAFAAGVIFKAAYDHHVAAIRAAESDDIRWEHL